MLLRTPSSPGTTLSLAVQPALPCLLFHRLIFATDLPSTQCAFGVASILWEVAGIKNDIDMTLAAILYTYHLHR